MTATDLVAVVLLLLVAAYACGGGADFGAGIWDLLAGGKDRGARPRALVDYAMAPVWEANNVWLVFILVVTWTGFPPVFEAVMSTTWLAVTLAALGLVARGAAFAIRKPTHRVAGRRRSGPRLRDLLHADPVLPRGGPGRSGVRPRPAGQPAGRPGHLVAQPDVRALRSARARCRRVRRRVIPGLGRASVRCTGAGAVLPHPVRAGWGIPARGHVRRPGRGARGRRSPV